MSRIETLRQMGLSEFRRRSFEVAQRLVSFIQIHRDEIVKWAKEVRPGYLDQDSVSYSFFRSLDRFKRLGNIESATWTDGITAEIHFDPENPFSLFSPWGDVYGKNSGEYIKLHFLILLAIKDKLEEADSQFLELVHFKACLEEAVRWFMDGKWRLNQFGIYTESTLNTESTKEVVDLIKEFEFCVRTDTD